MIATLPLKKTTFWDIDINILDLEKDKIFIITRVLTRGTDNEILFVENHYTKEEIVSALNTTKGIDKKTKNYYNLIFI